jgi:hypothetical protein
MVLDEPIKDHEIAHFVFNEKPPTLAILGYEVNTFRDCSLVLPYSLQPNQERRATYQEIVRDLASLYKPGYWAHEGQDGVKLSRSKAERERLYLKLANEWVHLVANELPRLYSTISDVEIER